MKRQYSLILAVSFMMFYNLASGVQFTDCGSKNGKLTDIAVSGCTPLKFACIIMGDTPTTIRIGFTVSEVVTKVRATAHFKYQKRNNSMLNSDGCVNSGLKCPLKKGTNHLYRGEMATSKAPTGPVSVISRLLDQNNEVIVCAKFTAIFQ